VTDGNSKATRAQVERILAASRSAAQAGYTREALQWGAQAAWLAQQTQHRHLHWEAQTLLATVRGQALGVRGRGLSPGDLHPKQRLKMDS
jgi:hypothetical protein